MAEVLQCDRDAAAKVHEWLKSPADVIQFILSEHSDADTLVQHFAAHREAAEKAERQAVGQRILMCLGQWRDQMPPDCVKDFQNIAKGWGYD